MMDIGTLIAKVNNYKNVLANTIHYRKQWGTEMKPLLKKALTEILEQSGLEGEIREQDKIENLEAVILDLGRSSSGISENLDDSGVKRTMIKSNGALIYQQLFNGKVMVMIASPNIEGYGEPKPPKTMEILRPDELTEPFILRHVEAFLRDITEWEDFDDDEPQKPQIGFQPIGFNQNYDDE